MGYFWSAVRGHSVSESFSDPPAGVDRAVLDIAVVQNVLGSGAQVDWDVLINGTNIGSFTVQPSLVGPIHLDYSFSPIANDAGQYLVQLVVTNEVRMGKGSHTLAYAGDYPHSIQLFGEGAVVIPTPGALVLAGIGAGLVGHLRRWKYL